jgi:NADP-dependent 3-hydroxy acid dehydrogenase YdfG
MVARRRARLEELAAAVRADGGAALVVPLDITEPGRAAEAVDRVIGDLGRIDVLVNNAGVMLLGPALGARTDDWDRMLTLNVQALLHVAHAALPHLVEAAATSARRVADVVNVSSTAGRVARPGSSVYNLTKFGLNAFAEALRQELVPQRVRVSVVEPGTVETELLGQLSGPVREAAERQVEGIEMLRSEDIADAVAYIVTRPRRIAVNELLVRAGDQTW